MSSVKPSANGDLVPLDIYFQTLSRRDGPPYRSSHCGQPPRASRRGNTTRHNGDAKSLPNSGHFHLATGVTPCKGLVPRGAIGLGGHPVIFRIGCVQAAGTRSIPTKQTAAGLAMHVWHGMAGPVCHVPSTDVMAQAVLGSSV